MSNEISVTAKLSFTKGGKTSSKALSAAQFTMTGTDYVQGTQSIGTSAEAIAKGDITTPGWMWVKNLDGTNYLEIHSASFVSTAGTIKLKAGECALFRLSSTAPYALANTAACEIEYLLIED